MAPPRRPRVIPGPGSVRRRLSCVAVTGAVLSGVLVWPLPCWAGQEQDAAVERSVWVDPVPRSLREEDVEVTPARVVDTAAVLADVEQAASRTGATVRAVVDRNGRTLLETAEADRPVLSASLVKLFVVQRLLARTGAVDASTRAQMERAITTSDDGAMSALWSRYDGAALVREAAAEFGLTGTAPPDVPGQWGEAWTTAADVARFLSALAAEPERADAATLLGWMRAARPVAADGFDQTFGLLSDAGGTGVGAKQGWMCCVDGRRQLHSAGVLADGRVVVVLGEVSARTGWAAAASAVDGAAAALVAGTA